MTTEIFAETNKIYESILDSTRHTKYYHLKSLHNFILHLNELENVDDKNTVHDLFKGYNKYVQENLIDENKSSLELYNKFIKPMGKLYMQQAKFKFCVGHPLYIFIFIVGNLWILFSKAQTRSFLIFDGIIFILICRELIIRRSSRVFGFKY